MKNFHFVRAIIFAVVLIVGGCINQSVYAENWKSLEVLNLTGSTIDELYISTSGFDGWGRSLLISPLSHGNYTTINYDSDYRWFDMKIIIGGQETLWQQDDNRLDLESAWRITLYKIGANYRWYRN